MDDREEWVLVPLILPDEVLGSAASARVFETGNPKHGWDYLLRRVGVRAHPLHPAAFEAEELIGRLMSEDPTHEDCEAAATLLRQLTATVTPNALLSRKAADTGGKND